MTTNGIRHIVWDWNGTLLDDIHASLQTINRLLVKRRLPVIDLTQYRDIFGFPVKDCYIKMGFDLGTEDWDAVAREFHDVYMVEARDVALRDGIVPVLENITGRGIPMSVLSASELSILETMLTAKGIRHYFKSIYGHADLYGSSKVELGRRVLRDLKIPSNHVLLVGDTDHDYEVARELNCPCVLIAGGHQAEERLRRCGCRVMNSVGEFLSL
jgi:phosphoglycolate phosphatase